MNPTSTDSPVAHYVFLRHEAGEVRATSGPWEAHGFDHVIFVGDEKVDVLVTLSDDRIFGVSRFHVPAGRAVDLMVLPDAPEVDLEMDLDVAGGEPGEPVTVTNAPSEPAPQSSLWSSGGGRIRRPPRVTG